MNKFGKATLMAGASALALGLAASQASAFEDVDWEWDTNINEKIKIYINPDFKFLDPRGLVQVESLQISIGDIKATSEVKHIYNKVADTYGDPISVPVYSSGYAKGHLGVYGKTRGHLDVVGTASGPIETYGKTKGHLGVYGKAVGEIDVYGKAKDDCWWGKRGKKCDYDPVKASGYADLGVYGKTYGKLKTHSEGWAELDVYGKTKGHLGVRGRTYGKLKVNTLGYAEIPVIVPNTLDDLAEINSSAVAVANLATVQGNSAVFVHAGQFSFGGFKDFKLHRNDAPALASLDDSNDSGGKWWHDQPDNEHNQLAGIALIAAGLGLIEPAHITATSTVKDILNANVNSSATAVANLHTIDVDAELATDVMVIADITQFQYGNVTATSTVKDVTAYHFAGLGGLENGLVNSSAVAVGNMSNINVSVGAAAAATE
jgi:hypothetical protein